MSEVQSGSPPAREKRAYEPPDVEASMEFETLALACPKGPLPDPCELEGEFELS